MTLDLDAIETRCAAATPGPWPTTGLSVRHDGLRSSYALAVGGWRDEAFPDAEFAASARTDVPALVARVRELLADRDARDVLLAKAIDTESDLLACLRTTVYAIRHCHGHMELVDWARVRRVLGESEREDDE